MKRKGPRDDTDPIPKDVVLLIPDAEEGEMPSYGVKPGYYNSAEMLDLLQKHQSNPDAIYFIADMLEIGDPAVDQFANTLKRNCKNEQALAGIIKACR